MRSLLVVSSVLFLSLAAGTARAEGVDCPPGSVSKSAGASTYCEPSVCSIDAQCGAGEVCKSFPLCVEIGAGKGADAGPLLMARQRCGIDQACPASTKCLDGMRCISKAQADKLAAPASSAPASAEPAKKACGCRVAGAPSSGGFAALACVAALVALDRRRSAKRP